MKSNVFLQLDYLIQIKKVLTLDITVSIQRSYVETKFITHVANETLIGHLNQILPNFTSPYLEADFK